MFEIRNLIRSLISIIFIWFNLTFLLLLGDFFSCSRFLLDTLLVAIAIDTNFPLFARFFGMYRIFARHLLLPLQILLLPCVFEDILMRDCIQLLFLLKLHLLAFLFELLLFVL